jgi:hypothetical protein
MRTKPIALPILVINNIGKKEISVDAMSEAPTTTTTSLGEGGKTFSIKEKKNKTK